MLEEKQQAYERAVEHKNAFNDTLRTFFDEHVALPLGDERNSLREDYVRRLRTSFVKAGLWREIADFSSTYYENAQAQLVGKALAGELSEHDLQFETSRGDSTKSLLRWINDKRNGINSDAPKLESIHLAYSACILLETLVPDLIGQLDGWPSVGPVRTLTLQLAVGKDKATKETYTMSHDVIFPENKLRIALLMAQNYEKKRAETKAVTDRQQQVQEALELLNPGETPNSYLADAVRFASQLINDANIQAPQSFEIRHQTLQEVTIILAKHAVTTGNVPLAEKVYNLLSPSNKWFLYAKAYEAGFNGTKLAEWRGQLDQRLEPFETKAAAARLVALTQIELLNSQVPEKSGASLIRAVAYKEAFQALINTSFIQNDQVKHMNLSNTDIVVYNQMLKIAFAKAGQWEQVGDLVKNGEQKDRASQLTAQALAGQLKGKAVVLARSVPNDTVEVLQWVNDRINNKDAPPPQRPVTLPESVRVMLSTLAPQLVQELISRDRYWLRTFKVAIANDDVKTAYREYLWHTGILNDTTDPLEAALLMSQHKIVLAESASRDVDYYDAFRHQIAPIEASVAEYINPDIYFDLSLQLREWYKKLFGADQREKLHELLTPQQLFLAKARLARLYAKAIPNGGEHNELNIIQQNLLATWNTFEQHEDSLEQLPEVVREMRAMGYTFIKRWKSYGQKSYVGYDPVLPTEEGQQRRGEIIHTTRERLMHRRTAAITLNELLGEKRYIIAQLDQENTWEIQGSWTNYITHQRATELYDAVGHLEAIGHPLVSYETSIQLTQRLEGIMTPLLFPSHDIAEATTEPQAGTSGVADLKIGKTGEEIVSEPKTLESEISYETLIAQSPSIGPRVFFPGTFGAHSNNLAAAVTTSDLFVRDEHGIRVGFRPREEMLTELTSEYLSKFGQALKEIITNRIFVDIGCGLPDLSQVPLLISQAFGAQEYHGVDKHMPNEEDLQQIVADLGVSDLPFSYHQDDALRFLSRLPHGQGFVFHLSGIESMTPEDQITREYIDVLLTEMQRVTKPGDAIIIGLSTRGFQPENYGFVLKHAVIKRDTDGEYPYQRVYVKEEKVETP